MSENKKLKPVAGLMPGDVTVYGTVKKTKRRGKSMLVWTDKYSAAVTMPYNAQALVYVDVWGDYYADCTRHDTQ